VVASANPRFKDFRADFEKISNAASKMCREEGSDDVAAAMYLDRNWEIRIPLQRRYVENGAFEAVAHYHAKRFKLEMGRSAPWPDEPAWHALRLFAEHGRSDLGVALIRTYADMQHKRLKQDYSKRNPRGPRKNLDETMKMVLRVTNELIADGVPDAKRHLLRDLEAAAPYVEEHGTAEDRAWFDQLRREIWMEKRA
jgi:hypothetical protein